MAFVLTETAIVFIKVAVLIVAGLLIGICGKIALRKYLQKRFLKKVLQNEPSVYNHVNFLIKLVTEAIQWIAIVVFFNYGLIQLDIFFLNAVLSYIAKNAYTILLFITIVVIGIILSKVAATKIKEKEIHNAEQIGLIVEFVLLFAFILTGFEFIGVKATALSDLYRVVLYVVGAIIVIVTSASLIKGKISIRKK